MEGLLAHFEAKFPYDTNDPRKMGFFVGQQITGLYIIEMLLKYAMDNAGVPHGQHHKPAGIVQEPFSSTAACCGAKVH